MKNYNIYASRLAPATENFTPGHRACVGCGETLAVRLACKAIGNNAIISNATGCMEIVSTPFPTTNWRLPWIHTLFNNTAAVASGIDSGLKAQWRKGKRSDKNTKVVAMGGDGATFDIGLQALSGAFERYHDMVYICWDNEAYMNTGVQRSSSTPFGAHTTTSPSGKESSGQRNQKKNMPAIAVAHGIPYVATASPSYPFDMMEKIKKALKMPGPAYIQVLSVCPTGWRSPVDLSVTLGRLAVETGVYPLYEVVNGQYRMTQEIENLRPIQDYLKPQGRFRHLTPDAVNSIQEKVKEEYAYLKKISVPSSVKSNKCISCGLCTKACTEVVGQSAIKLVKKADDDKKKGIPFFTEKDDCIACGSCAYVCPTEAILMLDDGDTRTIKLPEEERTFKMQGCSKCGKYFAPVKQIAFMAQKSGRDLSFFEKCPDCR